MSRLLLTLVVVLAVGPWACKGSGDAGSNRTSACLSCAMKACPSQATACDASRGCQTLRACSLACEVGDAECQTGCAAAASGDSNAINAAANYVACAQPACPNECSGAPATSGSAGSSGAAGHGGTTGTGGSIATGTGGSIATGTGGSIGTGTGGAGGTGGSGTCAAADAKLATCGASRNGACVETDLDAVCINKCILNSSYNCSAILASSGAFVDCEDTCDVTAGQGNVFTVAAGGYVTAGAWKGYAWTATDGVSSTTINPTSFSSLAADGQLCVSGTVAGTADYSAVAILGFSINQPSGSPAPAPSTWTPSGGGISYGVTNPGGSPLRIQLQAAGGDTDPTKRWCYTVNGNVGTPYWSLFNTKCWDGTGAGYDGVTPLQSVMVLVPGDTVPVSYNFCIIAITPHP